jgi:hypothetical protein
MQPNRKSPQRNPSINFSKMTAFPTSATLERYAGLYVDPLKAGRRTVLMDALFLKGTIWSFLRSEPILE